MVLLWPGKRKRDRFGFWRCTAMQISPTHLLRYYKFPVCQEGRNSPAACAHTPGGIGLHKVTLTLLSGHSYQSPFFDRSDIGGGWVKGGTLYQLQWSPLSSGCLHDHGALRHCRSFHLLLRIQIAKVSTSTWGGGAVISSSSVMRSSSRVR